MNWHYISLYLIYRPVKLLSFMSIFLVFFWNYSRVLKRRLLMYSLLILTLISSVDCILPLLVPELINNYLPQTVLYVLICTITAVLALRRLVNVPGSILLYAISVTMEYAVFISSNMVFELIEIHGSLHLIWDSFITLVVGIGVCVIVYKFISPLFTMCYDKKIWLKLSVTPIAGTIGLFIIYDLQKSSDFSNITYIGSIIIFIALMASNAIGSNSIRQSILAAEYSAKLKSVDELLTMQKERYSEIAATVAHTRQARHDLRHQMNVMSGLLESGKYDALSSYFYQYKHEIPEAITSTGNDIADLIIGKYLTQAQQAKITIDYQLKMPEDCRIEDTDLTIVMGNCLENAVEACMKLPENERNIRVISLIQGAYFGLTFENSFNGEVNEQDGELISSKRIGNESGIGLSSVRRVVEKYNGNVKISHNGNVFRVAVVMEYR